MRFPLLAPEQWNDAQRRVAEAIIAGPRGELRGPFVPLLHSPELSTHVQQLGAYIRFATDIPDDLLEVATLLTARRFDCPGIWVSHRVLAAKAGVPDDIVVAIKERRRPVGLSAAQTEIFDFCEQLARDNAVTDATFQTIAARWSLKGAMDLAGLTGYYGLLAQILNVAQPPLPDGAEPFGV